MLLQRRNLINMFSGGLGFIIPMILNLLFTPFIFSSLGNEAYGLQNLVNVLIGYLMVADMGLDIPITKLVSRYFSENDFLSLKKLVNTSIQIYTLMGLVGLVLCLVGSGYLVHHFFSIPPALEPEALQIFQLAAFGFFTSLINMWGKAIFNGLQRYEISNAVSSIQSFAAIVSGIILLKLGYGVVAFVLVKILFMGLSALFYILFVYRRSLQGAFTWGLDQEIWVNLKSQIGYGVVLRISGLFFSRLDQTFIAAFLGVGSVGLYAIPLLITNSISSLLASLTHFTFPKVVELQTHNKQAEIKELFFNSSKFIAVVASLGFLPFLAFGDRFLSLWISPEAGKTLMTANLVLCISIYLNSLTNIILNTFMVGLGQLRLFTYYSFGKGIILAGAFYLMIKYYGLEGAAFAVLGVGICDLVFLLFSLRWILKISFLELFWEVYFQPVVLVFGLTWFGQSLKFMIHSWGDLVIGSAINGILFILILLLFNYIPKKESLAYFHNLWFSLKRDPK